MHTKESHLTRAVAQRFAQALDHEDYATLADLLADGCEYVTPKGPVIGSPAVIASYQSAGAWVKSHIQHVRYESVVRINQDGSAIVTFIDHLEHNGLAQGRVCHIVHIDPPGECEAADAFLKTIGVERGS